MRIPLVRGLKHATTLGLACLCLACTTPASAKTTFSAHGDYDISGSVVDQPASLLPSGKPQAFSASQRVRLFLTARSSDSTSFFALLRFRPFRWGEGTGGGALDADQVNLRVRQARLDWREPGSPLHIRVGLIPLILPGAAFYSSVMFTSGGGVQAAYDITPAVTAKIGWYRPYDDYELNSDYSIDGSNNLDDSMDLMQFSLPVNYAGFELEPWVMHGRIGKDSSYFSQKAVPVNMGITSQPGNPKMFPISVKGKNTVLDNGVAWWGGLSGIVRRFDPLSIKYDFAYGKLTTGEDTPNFNAEGWYADIAVDYKMKWGTPGLFGWYATGSDYDDVTKRNKWGYIPTISANDEGFNPTSFGFAGAAGINTGNIISRQASGHFGVGAQVKDIPSFGALRHLVRVAYFEGTNDKELASMDNPRINRAAIRDNTFLTKGDSVYEINVNHEYPIYQNLIVSVDTGYLNLNRGSHWKDSGSQDAWQFATNFKYRF